MVAIDLFAGAGGMSSGAKLAGIDIKLAVERDPYAASTFHSNHPSTRLIADDIRRIDKATITSVPREPSPTIIFGGPPCQGFSFSNTRTRTATNKQNWLFREFLQIVRIWEPDFVVFENVQGIITTANGTFLEQIIEQFDKLKYKATYGLLNARDFGVPQDRTRFFLIAARSGHSIPLPLPIYTHAITVDDAIRDLPQLHNGALFDWLPYSEIVPSKYAIKLRTHQGGCSSHYVTKNSSSVLMRYRHVPPGGNWENIPPHMMNNYTDRTRCHTGIYRRLDLTRPSVVIANYRKNMLIHPSQNRGLSVREAARIQSFPDSYRFTGSIGFRQQQVGNAVPPFLAAAVFQQIRRQIQVPSPSGMDRFVAIPHPRKDTSHVDQV